MGISETVSSFLILIIFIVLGFWGGRNEQKE